MVIVEVSLTICIALVVWLVSCTVFTGWPSISSGVRTESCWEQWVCDWYAVLCISLFVIMS